MEFLLSAFFGGATGLFGSIVGKVFGWLETREKRKNMALEFTHELAILEAQGRIHADELEAESVIVQNKVAGAVRKESYRHDISSGTTYMWVSSVLRRVRPTLTVMLIGLTASIVWTWESTMVIEIANQCVYLTGMSIAWWFGDRAPQEKK